jgi:hypothetical protein
MRRGSLCGRRAASWWHATGRDGLHACTASTAQPIKMKFTLTQPELPAGTEKYAVEICAANSPGAKAIPAVAACQVFRAGECGRTTLKEIESCGAACTKKWRTTNL